MAHGASEHTFDVIHELPNDVSQETMDVYESLYIEQYKACGVETLNLMTGRSNGKHTAETKEKISSKNKGRKMTEYQIRRIKETHCGKVVSDETRMKQSLALKGKCGFFGKTHTEEWKGKMKLSRSGFKHSEESKLKMSKSKRGNANRLGKKFSDESRKKISESRKGKRIPQESIDRMKEKLKGRVFTDEWRQKLSAWQVGRKLTEEHKDKVRQANIGKKASEETKRKMSESQKRRQAK
jgi:hypothetical protein